jgi:hypothetical protein
VLELGEFDALFFADVLSLPDFYGVMAAKWGC